METKQLGNSGIAISAIGLGAMPMSLSGRPPEEQAIQVIHRALDLGVTFIDTADCYCEDDTDMHHNERLICKALQQYPNDTSNIVVATKGGLVRQKDGKLIRNGNPDHLRQTIRASFEALGGSKPIDLWHYHAPDTNYPIKDALKPAKEAVEEGLIRCVGVSNFSIEQIKRARDVVEIVSVQNQYSPLHRQPETNGVLKYCETEGLSFLTHRPLGSRFHVHELKNIPVLAELAQEKGVSVYCIALAWLRAKSPCILPIPGATKLTSIEDSVRAVEVKLSADDVKKIDRGTLYLQPKPKPWNRIPGISLLKSVLRIGTRN